METFEAIKSRRSIRRFTNDVITQENLDRLLEAAEAAPAAMGKYEDLHLTIITDAKLLDQIDRAGAEFFGKPDLHPLYQAPMLIVVSVRKPAPGRENAVFSTAACVVENMALGAVDLGVGAVHIWGAIAAINQHPDLVGQLQLPEGFVPSCALAVGQTEEEYSARTIDEERIAKNYLTGSAVK